MPCGWLNWAEAKSPSARPEEVPVAAWARLADALADAA